MKKNYLLTFMLFFVAVAQSAVLTVSNDPANPGQYNTIDSAMVHANPHDTLYIQPSLYTYGGITITKPLTIMGVGHHVQKDIPFLSYVQQINIRSRGVIIDGLSMTQGSPPALDMNSNFPLDSIRIRNCEMTGSINSGYANSSLSDCIIENNIIWGNNGPWAWHLYGGAMNNVIARNNIFYNKISNSVAVFTLDHNFFFSTTNTEAFNTVSNAIITNNIFYIVSPQGAATSVFNNNITYNTSNNTIPYGSNTGAGNQVNTDPKLVNYPTSGQTFLYTHDYHLQSTSPGLNAATDGSDIGLWGGVGFSMTGEPVIPVVRQMNIKNPNVPVGGTLNVQLKSSKAGK